MFNSNNVFLNYFQYKKILCFLKILELIEKLIYAYSRVISHFLQYNVKDSILDLYLKIDFI